MYLFSQIGNFYYTHKNQIIFLGSIAFLGSICSQLLFHCGPYGTLGRIDGTEIQEIGIYSIRHEIAILSEEDAATLIPLLSQLEFNSTDLAKKDSFQNLVGASIVFEITMKDSRTICLEINSVFFRLDEKYYYPLKQKDSYDEIRNVFTMIYPHYFEDEGWIW